MTKCKVAKHNYNIINCSNTNVRSNKSAQVHWFRFAMSEDNNDFGAAKEGPYRCGVCGAKRFQWLNTVGWLTFFMFTFCTIYGFNINGALLATITTMEQLDHFGHYPLIVRHWLLDYVHPTRGVRSPEQSWRCFGRVLPSHFTCFATVRDATFRH